MRFEEGGDEVTGIGVGVVGVGMIGPVHVRAARANRARLVGVVASTPTRSRQAAEHYGAERAFVDAEQLIHDPDVDVVHVCSPNYLHLPLTRLALEAGKHVICEKPLATRASEAQALWDLARRQGLVAAVPFVYRYYALVRELRHRGQAAGTGGVRLIHGSYLQDWLLEPGQQNWRTSPDMGGESRAFGDIGSHWCDLASFISGQRIASVSAQEHFRLAEDVATVGRSMPDGRSAGTGGPTEDAVTMQFRTEHGAVGSVIVSQVSPGRKNQLKIEFSTSSESFAFNQETPSTAWVGRLEGAQILVSDQARLSRDAARMTRLPAGHPEGFEHCFESFVGDVYEAVRTGSPPDGLPTFTDGVRAARTTDAVLESARSGAWVDVPLEMEAG